MPCTRIGWAARAQAALLLSPTRGVLRIPLTRARRPAANILAKQVGGLPLENYLDVAYRAEIDVGTPGQPIYVSFDSNGDLTWLPAKAALAAGTKHVYFAPGDSSTFQWINRLVQRPELHGRMARDALSFGPSMSIEGFEFGVLTNITAEWYEDWAADGRVGLGFGTSAVPPVLQALKDAGGIEEPVFAFDLRHEGGASELTLGGASPERAGGSFSYVSLATPTWWSVPLDAVWVGDEVCLTHVGTAILNPGQYKILGPEDQMTDFLAAWNATLQGADWVVPCGQQGPPLHFRIQGRDFTIAKDDFIVKEGSICYFLAGTLASDDHSWLLGQLFLRKFYTVFDAGRKRVGSARPSAP